MLPFLSCVSAKGLASAHLLPSLGVYAVLWFLFVGAKGALTDWAESLGWVLVVVAHDLPFWRLICLSKPGPWAWEASKT